MKTSTRWSVMLACGVAVAFAASAPLNATVAAAVPDPCKLVTVAELEQIVGPLKGKPIPGDIKAGDLSCEYPLTGMSSVVIRLHEGSLAYWKHRNGGEHPLALPELGRDAFVNPDFEGSADLYVGKGTLILRITMPKGPKAVDDLKRIVKKALTRM